MFSDLLEEPAPWAAAISWVETAAACLAAISNFLITFFLRGEEAAAFTTARRCSAANLNCSWASSSYKNIIMNVWLDEWMCD